MVENRRVVIVAPHPDDESLGAGGTAAKFAAQGCEVSVLVVSGHLPPLYTREQYETTVCEAKRAFQVLGVANHRFLEVPATMVGTTPVHELNGAIEQALSEWRPQVLLLPFPDRHVDHRAIFDSVLVGARPVNGGRGIELLAAYETLSETHWNAPHIEPNFVPNWVVDITDFMETKLRAVGCYGSQIPPFPGPRSVEAVEALARFRGTQAGFACGEGFHIIRMKS